MRVLAYLALTFAYLLLMLLLAGCGGKPEETRPVGVDYQVDKLFTIDSCTVYRFADAGSYRYFTNCSGSASWRQSCGKSCSREASVEGGSK